MTPFQWLAVSVLPVYVIWRLKWIITRENRGPIMGARFSWPPTAAQIRNGLAVTALGTGYILVVTSSSTGPTGLAAGIACMVGGIITLAIWGRRGQSA